MRLARKLFLLSAMALAAMAMTASSASALEVFPEAPGEHCDPVTVTAHIVSGGCHVNAESEEDVPLFVHIPGMGETQLSNCQTEFEARFDELGEGYITDQVFHAPMGAGACTQTPCDEVEPSHRNLPWRAHLREVDGAEFINVTFCLRSIATSEGAAGTQCTVNLPMANDGHEYEFLATNAGGRCVQNPALGIEGHFITHHQDGDGPEEIEVIH